MKTYHIYAACACVEFCRALWSLWETYHAFKIKICTSSTLGLSAKTCLPFRSTQICTSSTLRLGAKTCLPFRSTQNCFTPTLGKTFLLGFIHNKCSKSLFCISLKTLLQKRHKAIRKRKKKKRKEKERKKRRERKLRIKMARVLTKVFQERDIF